jgi:hypothetical protein
MKAPCAEMDEVYDPPMRFACPHGNCLTPRWMRPVLLAAAIYHLAFALWANLWPNLCFDWMGMARPNHPMLWQGLGLMMGMLGIGQLFAAASPIERWPVVLVSLVKYTFGIVFSCIALVQGKFPLGSIWMVLVDSAIWWVPFVLILWASVRAHTGVPPTRSTPYTIQEAADTYRLSSGETLAKASESKLLALVFLRHFGCTFTRQILRELEGIEREARENGAVLVLVHMLQSGKETEYLGERSGIARIADPRCELYRAFGLGKGGFLDLFGPRVWWRGALSLFKGCGVGHLAGDGLQMPGAFLFHRGEIISSQPACSASDLPDLPQLFKTLPSSATRDTLTA